MKMRTLKLTPKSLLDALQGKTETFVTNLPADVQLLDLRFDLCSNQVFAVIRSDSFEDVAELYPIPELKLIFTKASVEPALSSKSEVKTVTTIQSQPVSRMEQEFTPEQRKLLSFKVENERVIVKPTRFLKAEWEDINATVKSLGGKWVKGDIISYWEIPLQHT